MFTGIIETLGILKGMEKQDSNVHFDIHSFFTSELKVDQSIAHDGVCLTVVAINGENFRVTAIDETLSKTNLKSWNLGKNINLERCMPVGGRFDGHIVQGHVDQVGIVESIRDQEGSWQIEISFDPSIGNLIVEKGSIAVNGTSLTCFNSKKDRFSVAIIPYTFEHTNFHQLKAGDEVNLEFDIMGKYVQRILKNQIL